MSVRVKSIRPCNQSGLIVLCVRVGKKIIKYLGMHRQPSYLRNGFLDPPVFNGFTRCDPLVARGDS